MNMIRVNSSQLGNVNQQSSSPDSPSPDSQSSSDAPTSADSAQSGLATSQQMSRDRVSPGREPDNSDGMRPSKEKTITASPSIVIEDDLDSSVILSGLCDLYRHCYRPLDLYKQTLHLVEHGFPINIFDDTGCTAISLLVLHINRGLRYHQYRLPKLAELENAGTTRKEIFSACVELDRQYQEDVYKCLKLILSCGGDSNILPAKCPGIAHESDWSENYEHKIMQSDQRWNLFTFGGSMEFTTYSIFNPLSCHRPSNAKNITVLHLSAWRGDAACLDLLLKHSADVHATTTDNRNALHFLYLYCNKPDDLVRSTELLIQYGIDVNLMDGKGRMPVHVLLNHFLVKRSHVKYLANAYTESNIRELPVLDDHYRDEIRQCMGLLLDAGSGLDLDVSPALHYVYGRFEYSLTNCEPEFQEKGHYLVPYHFKLEPLLEVSQHLVELGCKVNARDHSGHTSLHVLVMVLRDLSLDEKLNSRDIMERCFTVLLAEGVDVNAKDGVGKTALHYLVENVCNTLNALSRYLGTMRLLVSYGADLKSQDHDGNTVLHIALRSRMKAEHLHRLTVFLLQSGADCNQANVNNKYPLNELMIQHIYHHEPLSVGGVPVRLDQYLHTMDLICRTMSSETLQYIFSVYRESGFWGIICERQCPVHQLLSRYCDGVSCLKHICRLVIRNSMASGFLPGIHQLPLPKQLQQYVQDLFD